MWITFTVALFISLTASYFFLIAHRRRSRTLEGIVAIAAMMICLAIAPLPIKFVLLVSIFIAEQWRVRWEKAQTEANNSA